MKYSDLKESSPQILLNICKNGNDMIASGFMINYQSLEFVINNMDQYQGVRKCWEVGKFEVAHQKDFEEIAGNQSFDLYIYKRNVSNIVVRLLDPQRQLLNWKLTKIQISQYYPVTPDSQHQSSTLLKISQIIKFNGELIFTLLPHFCKLLKRQILSNAQQYYGQLKDWCDADITDIYGVSEKSQCSMGFKHSFMKIKSVIFNQMPPYYFQNEKYIGEENSHLVDFEEEENIKGSTNICAAFNQLVKLERQRIKDLKEKRQLQEVPFKEQQSEGMRFQYTYNSSELSQL